MRLEYSGANRSGKLNIAFEIISAFVLGGAFFAVLLSMFGLKWGPASLFRGNPGGGLSHVWNSIADAFGETDYIIFDKVNVSGNASGSAPAENGYGLFLTITLAVLIVIAFLVVRSRFRPLLLIFVIPVITLLFFGITPGLWQGLTFSAAILIAVSVMTLRGGAKPAYLIIPITSIILTLLIASAVDYTVGFGAPDIISQASDSTKETALKVRFGSDALPHGRLYDLTGDGLKKSRGSIDDVKKALGNEASKSANNGNSGIKGTALEVTMSDPASVYLRGFVGSEYDGESWSDLDDSTYYDLRDKTYWLNKQGFDGLTEMSTASSLAGYEDKKIDVDIRVRSASRETAFTPYEFMGDSEGDSGAETSEKEKLTAVTIPGAFKNYAGSRLGNKGVFGSSSYGYKIFGNITGEWTDAVGKFYTADKSEAIDEFFVSESNYNVIQYDNYVDLPDGLVSTIKKEIGSPGDISRNHADYKTAINTIRKYLNDNYVYSETFDKSGSKDFASEFIKGKRGSDVHFATLATLMFRYYGIPARYIEGYLVTPGNVKGAAEGETISVGKEANHAWTEIYIDGFGWVPIEVTSEYSGIMKETDMEKGLKNVDYESRKNKKMNTADDEEEADEEEGSGSGNILMKILLAILIIIVAGLLLAILSFLVYLFIKWARWRLAFRDQDPRRGVRALYQFGNEKKWAFSKAGDEIGLRASYSISQVTENDRISMKSELKSAKARAKAEKAAAKQALKEREALKMPVMNDKAEEKNDTNVSDPSVNDVPSGEKNYDSQGNVSSTNDENK